jgi:hypothetical protein
VPTVGSRGIGIMNSAAFWLLANRNLEVDGNQEMDLMIRSLNFHVGYSGLTRPSDPAKLDPSASETKTITMSGSSVGSSGEVNSPVSFTTAENTVGKIKELDETMENLDIGGTVDQSYTSQKDFITQSSGISSNIHQLCIIITEAVEENDPTDNAATHAQVDKSRSNSKKEKEKIHVSTGEWRIIMSAINHGMEVPANSRREVLMGYQYALHQHKKKQREEKDEIRRSQENNNVSSRAYWDEYNEASYSSRERHREPKHNRRTTARAREENHARSISAHPLDEEEDFAQETPEAALVATQVYLLTTQPEPGDPREHMQSRNKNLRLVEDRLRKHSPKKKTTRYEDKGKKSIKYQSSQTSDSSGDEKPRARRKDARNIIAQTRVNKA